MNECAMTNKVAKEPSVLEAQIGHLKSEVTLINRLTINISEMIMSPKPCSAQDCEKLAVKTISNSINEIFYIANETREDLENIAKLLSEQLGELKLDY